MYHLGKYIYIEASRPSTKGDKAWLMSPEVPPITSSSPKCLKFSYSMYGMGMGSLSVNVYDASTQELTKYWELSGDQGRLWNSAQLQLPTGTGLKVRLQ